jgi:hypothetical protein
MQVLVSRWDKCLNVTGHYIEVACVLSVTAVSNTRQGENKFLVIRMSVILALWLFLFLTWSIQCGYAGRVCNVRGLDLSDYE